MRLMFLWKRETCDEVPVRGKPGFTGNIPEVCLDSPGGVQTDS